MTVRVSGACSPDVRYGVSVRGPAWMEAGPGARAKRAEEGGCFLAPQPKFLEQRPADQGRTYPGFVVGAHGGAGAPFAMTSKRRLFVRGLGPR